MHSNLFAGLVIGGLAFAAYAAEPAKVESGRLVDQFGRTLYVFDLDEVDRSNCNAGCATVWPPLVADAEATAKARFSIVLRDDGSHQWAYEGKPLYRFAVDERPGDTAGDNFGGRWHTVRPAEPRTDAKPQA